MIYELKRQNPRISFGLGKLETTIATGETATLWVHTQYEATVVGGVIKPAEVSSTKISNHQFNLTSGVAGEYEIKVYYPKIERYSNPIILKVE